MQRVIRILTGEGLSSRALRGSALTVLHFGGTNALRLVSNLILTRILFPEAFGLMAIVAVITTALQMFSDVGLQTSVIRSARGDDPGFLNTAWTLQILRGGLLWLASVVLAAPLAEFYGEEMLGQLLPVAGFTIFILGFASVNILTVNRKLLLGRLTALELGSQIVGLATMVVAALILQSVWALVVGGLVSGLIKTVLSHVVLPGSRARFALERAAFAEMFGFGKWIFVSTLATFLIRHGDRAILGKYVTLTDLAFYNIALVFATIPISLNTALVQRVLFPLLCNRPPGESAGNRAAILRARIMLTGGAFVLCLPLALFGEELVALLYDPRYHTAGIILVGIIIVQLFQIITFGHDQALLAAGDSRSFAFFQIVAAVVRTGALVFGAIHYGIPGVIVATLASHLALYPVLVVLVRRYKAWYWQHDLGFAILAIGLIALEFRLDPTIWERFLALLPAGA
jgi:O-antigen/teichoic acid export membrane protein